MFEISPVSPFGTTMPAGNEAGLRLRPDAVPPAAARERAHGLPSPLAPAGSLLSRSGIACVAPRRSGTKALPA